MSDLTIALVGNPNSGKTTLFNLLTGLNQQTGNFPGVTVDKKSGSFKLSNKQKVELVDLPGTYSIYPKTLDERIVQEVILDNSHPQHPDAIIVVVDATNLKRNLLLFTQIRDLGIPCILVLNMIDVARKRGIEIDIRNMSIDLGVKIISTNSRIGEGAEELKKALEQTLTPTKTLFFDPIALGAEAITEAREEFQLTQNYLANQYLIQSDFVRFLSESEKESLQKIKGKHAWDDADVQLKETEARFQKIDEIVERNLKRKKEQTTVNQKIDNIITHPILGYAIFLAILSLIFQAIFAWAEAPMDLIEGSLGSLAEWVKDSMPAGVLNDLITDGIIAGLAGVLVFIPQIAILFGFISLLEESGYMARAVFLMDKIMRKFGLSGKSVVPLVSGMACAIPAIMSTRSIESWKDRLITIFVTPFMSCSARLPVYVFLVAFLVPDETVGGIFNLQGLFMLGLYLLGLFVALLVAAVMQFMLKRTGTSLFVLEMPVYRMPRWKNALVSM